MYSTEIIKKQHEIRKQYIEILQKTDPKIASDISAIFAITENKNRQNRVNTYQNILNQYPFGSDELMALMENYAKIMDIERRVRKFYNAKQYDERKNESTPSAENIATADQFNYVFEKMHANNVAPDVVKEFFEQNGQSCFSLTMHPTNPTTLDYTVNAGLKFDEALHENQDLTSALEVIINTKISGKKKTPIEEMQETAAILDTLYNSSLKVRDSLRKTLSKYPKYAEVIDSNKPLLKPAVWATGDGDGNDNANIEALRGGLTLLKNRIQELYIKDINELLTQIDDSDFDSTMQLIDIKIKIKNDAYKTPEELIEELSQVSNSENLIYKVKTFGFHYAKIDIRHNSVDVMVALGRIAQAARLIPNEDTFLKLSADEQKVMITNWFKDQNIVDQLANLSSDELGVDKRGQLANRIYGRLRILKDHPAITDKLIIAETNSAANVLAAMLLLKAAGNKVAEKDSLIDIVTLSESVADLKHLPKLIEELLEDPIYREHLQHRQQLIPMIAKSDTVRRNGRGAEAVQEETVGRIYAMQDKIKAKYSELQNLTVAIFNGGGAALQRGGGRISEVAHNHGRAARYFGATTMGPSTLTIQGHQMQILFSPANVATQNVEAFVAQNFYARAQTERDPEGKPYIPARVLVGNYNEKKAIEDFYKISEKMTKTYDKYMGDLDDRKNPGNSGLNELFYNAPWVPVILGNLSSRPPKRGGNINENDISASDIKDDKRPKLLNNRAITVERLSAHSGTHCLMFMSILEGLKLLTDQELHNMYGGNKLARDFIRNTALAAHMADFDHSWHMLIGEQRPSDIRLKILAEKFESRKFDRHDQEFDSEQQLMRNKEMLAWLELYSDKVAKKAYICAMGKAPPLDFTLQTLLQEAFPNLAAQLKERELSAEFGRFAEAEITRTLNSKSQDKLTPAQISTIKTCYAASDVTNAPEGGLSIDLTRKTQQSFEHSPHIFQRSLWQDRMHERKNNVKEMAL